MENILIPLVALLASVLTFFSGFGLGTLLLPAFAAFFPASLAVAATAVVHLSNNILKFGLTARYIDRHVFLRFGIPAILAGFAGAWLLTWLGDTAPIVTYSMGTRTHEITVLKLVIGVLMIDFAVLEFVPRFANWQAGEKWLPVGGLLSGFFGGLSGHQGAFRAAFLARAGLSGAQFIGTSVAIAVLIDLTRLSVYIPGLKWGDVLLANVERGELMIAAMLAAMVGTLIGSRFLHRTTVKGIRGTVAVLLVVLGLALAAGLI
ncbi:sulfite exporter TauE/SafE family protein [candidate division KSB1 bacterium]|nr:sulfite exporter TauE/SafE family protein [candidate division KSB1 bacterium]